MPSGKPYFKKSEVGSLFEQRTMPPSLTDTERIKRAIGQTLTSVPTQDLPPQLLFV